jgi:gliding motility-associated lipoprotein GldD
VKKFKRLGLFISSLICFLGCQSSSTQTPKPRAYHRIEFPDKSYQSASIEGPYAFDVPEYAKVAQDQSSDALPFAYDVHFPTFNATLHLTYHPFIKRATLDTLTEDARTLAFNHTIKATGIAPIEIHHPEKEIYGLLYEIKGNTASQIQFYVTDSIQHYVRGALYFNERPKIDSIQPVIDFLRKDIDHLLQNLRWH